MQKPNRYLLLVLVAAALGLLFASVSTRDFAMHLDRQVHDVNCSFTPGLSDAESGESGCLVTMVSPYSSVLREMVWGGVPIALPAMAVFAFLIAFGLEIMISGRQRDPRVMAFFALATALPLLASLVMASVSLLSLDAICKICVGIYVSSALAFAGAIGAWLRSRRGSPANEPEQTPRPQPVAPTSSDPAWVSDTSARPATEEPEDRESENTSPTLPSEPAKGGYFAAAFAVGVAFVVIPVLGYVRAAPDHSSYIGTCSSLSDTTLDPSISLQLGDKGEVPAIEVLDPLCPACRLFETRLHQSGFAKTLDRRAVLFPLDSECNWMIDKSVHPGACAISEAMLCAGDKSDAVLKWSFAQQEKIMTATKLDPGAAARMAIERFPELASCVGKSEVKSKLNRSLRWTVEHQIQVLTPQLFVGGVKLCDEDVDLGLAFALSVMVDRYRAGTLSAATADQSAPPEPVANGDAEAPQAVAPRDTAPPAVAPVDAAPAAPSSKTPGPTPATTSGTPKGTETPASETPGVLDKADAGPAPAAPADAAAPREDEPPAPAADDDLEPSDPGESQ